MKKNKYWIIKMIGLLSAIAYMVIILWVWITAELGGFTYFSAGEPRDIIRYTEWIIGIIGIFALIDVTKKEIKRHASRN